MKVQRRFCYLRIILIALLTACASQPPVGDVSVLKHSSQRAWGGAGQDWVLSDKRHNVGIRVWDANFHNGAADCTVWIKNNGNHVISLSTGEITLVGAQGTLPVLGKTEMLADLKKETEGKSIRSSVVGIVEVLAAGNDGYSRQTGTFEGDTDRGPVSGTYSGTSYDPAAAAAARQAAVDKQKARERSIRSNEHGRRAAVEDFYFDEIDIAPGDEKFAGFRFNLPTVSQTMQIGITIDGETHFFDLRYIREN